MVAYQTATAGAVTAGLVGGGGLAEGGEGEGTRRYKSSVTRQAINILIISAALPVVAKRIIQSPLRAMIQRVRLKTSAARPRNQCSTLLLLLLYVRGGEWTRGGVRTLSVENNQNAKTSMTVSGS